MFTFIKNWIARRKAAQKAALFDRGMAHANQALSQYGAYAIQDLEDHVECMNHFGDYNEFDEGVEEAIRIFRTSERFARETQA